MIQKKQVNSDSDSSDEDTVEELSKEKLQEMNKGKTNRTSVSAEAYGNFNKKTAF